MVRKGYFEQQMEQLGLVIGRLLAIRTSGGGGGEAEARTTLHAEAKSMTGINLALLPTLSDATLLSLFKGGNVLDAARCVIAAHLIAEDADIFQAEGKTSAAKAGYRRAVMLLDAAMVQEDVLQTSEYRAKRQEWANKFAQLAHSAPPAAAGFTLIELLVVIAIISILAAILFPVFAQAREKARQTSCLSNTKQIGLGIYGYIQDYDEMLPLGGYFFNKPGGQSRWFRDIDPYVKSVDVYNCPSLTDDKYKAVYDPATNAASTYFGHPGPTLAGGYGINFNLIGFYPSATQHDSETLASIKDSAGTFLITEAAQCGAPGGVDIMSGPDNAAPLKWPAYQTGASDCEVQPPTGFTSDAVLQYTVSSAFINTRRRPIARHSSGLNIIYCDGHAKWMPVEKFLGIPSNGVDPAPSVRGWPYGSPNNSWDNQ